FSKRGFIKYFSVELTDGIQQWMSHKIQFHSETAVEFFFKRQNHKHLINKRPKFMHALLLPRPNLRRNVIENLYSLIFHKLPEPHVEAGIIDKYHRVGLIGCNFLFAFFNILQNGA